MTCLQAELFEKNVTQGKQIENRDDCMLAFKKTNQNTQEVKHERFLISTRQNNVPIFGIRCL